MSGLLLVLCLGCLAGTSAQTDAPSRLDSCITYYQDGEYLKAVDSLKALLPLIADRQMEAEAYKYLGFSYVMLDRIEMAKEFFRVALEKFPLMEIDTLEVPPNISIVFRQTGLESQIARGDLVAKKSQGRIVLGTVFGASGVVSGAAAGYFGYMTSLWHQKYRERTDPPDQALYDTRWNLVEDNLTYTIAAGSVSAISLSVSLWLFLRRSTDDERSLSVVGGGDRLALEWAF